MNYQTFDPHPDLAAVVKCFWTLEVPAQPDPPRQRILPDGTIEMIFILGDDIKRYVSETEFILQPPAFVLGHISEPYFVEPTGAVDSFAVRLYPYAFANYTTLPLKELGNRETPLDEVFEKEAAARLERAIRGAADTRARIRIAEEFLFERSRDRLTADSVVKSTIDALLAAGGGLPIRATLSGDPARRKQLERKFAKQVGLSPKQFARVIRLQAALKMLLRNRSESRTNIAYESNYYDQAHFNKDFKEFTGVPPGVFYDDPEFALSSLIYNDD